LPGTKYHFRLGIDNGIGGPQFGADQTFTTAPAAGGGATNVTTKRATLTGTINPHGVATSYHFNYGATANYGVSTPEIDAGSGDGDRSATQDVSALLPDTTYHVQVVATSADGTVRSGADGLFRTAPAPTAVVVGPTGVSTDAATIAGQADTFGRTGSYHFDVWSLDSSYEHSTAERPLSGNASAERVSAALTELPAGETFVVQLIVASNDAIGASDLGTFATAALPRVFPRSVFSYPPDPRAKTLTPPEGPTAPVFPAKVSAAKVARGSSFSISVAAKAAGTVKISGSGLVSTTKKLTAGTVKIAVKLSKASKAKLKKKHSLKVKAKVVSSAPGLTASTTTVSVTLKA
jgi:hypothetical protein